MKDQAERLRQMVMTLQEKRDKTGGPQSGQHLTNGKRRWSEQTYQWWLLVK